MLEFLATIEVSNIIEENLLLHGKKRGLGITLLTSTKAATVLQRDAMYICMPLASYANRAHLQNMEHIPSKSCLN